MTRHPLAGYVGAAIVCALTGAAEYFLQPLLGDRAPLAVFPAAVVVAAWFGGFGPGLLVTLVGSLRVFQGLAHLFSYLPGDLGHKAENARNDAGELITTLNRASDTESVQADVEGGTAAECMRVAHLTGTLEVGKRADLLGVDGDPLADISVLQDKDKLVLIVRDGAPFKSLSQVPV